MELKYSSLFCTFTKIHPLLQSVRLAALLKKSTEKKRSAEVAELNEETQKKLKPSTGEVEKVNSEQVNGEKVDSSTEKEELKVEEEPKKTETPEKKTEPESKEKKVEPVVSLTWVFLILRHFLSFFCLYMFSQKKVLDQDYFRVNISEILIKIQL